MSRYNNSFRHPERSEGSLDCAVARSSLWGLSTMILLYARRMADAG